ncbi:MAG: hypothetical protein WCV85_01705 [Patescibacteria group bacterium]|jgi:hypothetical protein
MRRITFSIFVLGLATFLLVACEKTVTPGSNFNATQAINAVVQQNVNQMLANVNTGIAAGIVWQKTGAGWTVLGNPPSCPDPLQLQSPVDVAKATAILYPGQTRGGNYKPHGGFRFSSATNTVPVRAPLDAQLVEGSRYIEQGETQYLLVFQNPCGLRYRFDHLLTLAPAFATVVATLPAAQVDQSQTTAFANPVQVSAGDVIASAVGFAKTKNVSVDFGVYDLRQKNAASKNATWAASHDVEQAQYALCWLDLLPAAEVTTMKALPGADQTAGKTSDYCT